MDKSKWTLERVIMVVGFLATLGLGGYVKSVWNDSIQESMTKALEDPHSKFYQLIKTEANKISEAKAREIIRFEMQNTAQQAAFLDAFRSFRNLPSEDLVNYVQDKFNWADTVHAQWGELKANHEWIAEKRSEEKPDVVMCGYVLAKQNIPTHFKTCDGELRKIFYGKILNATKNVYYYRDNSDSPIILSYISRVIIN